ncbi:hypothetical protein JMJ77_0013050, partial [Colletotrichum scovillei]
MKDRMTTYTTGDGNGKTY